MPVTAGNRARSWGAYCPVCDQRYVLTNFMRRFAIDNTGALRDTDVHEAKCAGWEVLNRRTDRRHPYHPAHGLYVIEQARKFQTEVNRITARQEVAR